jgi:GDP-L-fucose synthase
MTTVFNGVRVLVAGGTGLIGIPLVKLLIEEGARVRVASLDDPSRAHPDCEFIRADLTVLENCIGVCTDMEFVFNLLGVKASPGVTSRRPATHMVPMVMMEFSLLEAARRCGVSGFLYTSSVGVYAPAEVFHEDDVWRTFPSPNDRFAGWGKRLGELQVEAYRIEYGWDRIAIARPANIYGPFDNFDSENAMVVPSLIKRAIEGPEELVVWGDGSARRDFLHAVDAARGLLAVARHMPKDPVNIGSGTGATIKELVEVICGHVDRPLRVRWDTTKPQGDRLRIMDTARATALGFTPQVSLDEGVKDTVTWYLGHRGKDTSRYDIFDSPRPTTG